MRVIVVGYGVQGPKRRACAGDDCVGIVDPVNSSADWKRIEDVPLDSYEAALVCTPDAPKVALLFYLLEHGKHVLVEKPLMTEDPEDLVRVETLSRETGAACYTAYNHRFEPHFIAVKELISSGVLGEIYRCRLFYGNGTARLVRNSEWRDQGTGVLPDLASHLLDTIAYWFGERHDPFHVISADHFENRSFDHVVIGAATQRPKLELEMTLLSWRNTFSCDIIAEKGSAHIESLSKWGGSTFTVCTRKLPSGRTDERSEFLVTEPLDKTWELEYAHFKRLCETGENSIQRDIWLNGLLASLSREALERYPA